MKKLVILILLVVVGGAIYLASSPKDNGNIKTGDDTNDTTNGDRVAAGYVAGHVTIGPSCPVEIEGEPCPIPPEAYTSRDVVVYESNSTTVIEKVKLDAEGNYKIALGPGTYFVQIDPAGIGPGEKKRVTVTSFETSTVDFDIDTGIR